MSEPGIRFDSSAHAPRSISLHRSEQNGLSGLESSQRTLFEQVGQATMRVVWVIGAVWLGSLREVAPS